MTAHRLRLAAYAVCLREDRVLLARYRSPDGTRRHWTLPGGKVEHAEDPYDAVIREVAEETGYQVQVARLLGVDSRSLKVHRGLRGGMELHSVGVFYRVHIVGGELRHEVGGSTDRAEWIPQEQIPELERAVIVDTGMELDRSRPAAGHIEPLPITGLRRY